MTHYDDGFYADDRDEDDEPVSMTEVRRRARSHFGNTEEADEAARLYPGDFI